MSGKNEGKNSLIGVAEKVINYFLPGIYRFYCTALLRKGQLSIYRYVLQYNPFSGIRGLWKFEFSKGYGSYYQTLHYLVEKYDWKLRRISKSEFSSLTDWFNRMGHETLKKMKWQSSDNGLNRFNSFFLGFR